MNFGKIFGKIVPCLFVGAAAVAVLLFLAIKADLPGFIYATELKTFDIRQSLTVKDRHVNDDVVIVTVDDESYEYMINRYGEWPVPREVYAKVLKYINSQNPYVTVFDLLFVHTMKSVPKSDKILADAVSASDNAFMAISFDNRDFEVRKPVVLPKYLTSELDIRSKNFAPYVYKNCRSILPELINGTSNIGQINTPKSDDGITRTVPLFVGYPRYTGKNFEPGKIDYYPYLTLKAAFKYLEKKNGEKFPSLTISENGKLVAGNRTYNISNKGEAWLNWYGNSGLYSDKTFKYIPMYKVVKAAENEGSLPPDTFKNKAVFIGTSVFSLSDIKSVPTAKYMPGVEIHATLFSNLTEGNFVNPVSLNKNLATTIVLCLLSAIIVLFSSSALVSTSLFASLMFVYAWAATYMLAHFNCLIWIAVPLMLAAVTFAGTYIIKYVIKSRDFDHVYKLATTDGLTELYNHRFFQEQLKICLEDAKRYSGTFSLIMIDIDFFKKFNDTYGHQAGDAVLKQVAATIKSTVRNSDIVCRYGGEEMTVILKNTDYDAAVATAQKLCENVAAKPYKITLKDEKNVTISLGVSSYPRHGATSREIIESADSALYKAKESGRNRVGIL